MNGSSQTVFSVFLVDSCGNPRSLEYFSEVPELAVTVELGGFPSHLYPVPHVTQNNSQLIVTYTPLYPGTYQVFVQLGGQPVHSSPITVEWILTGECTAYNPTTQSFQVQFVPLEGLHPTYNIFQPPNPPSQCSYYSENTCCSAGDATKALLSLTVRPPSPSPEVFFTLIIHWSEL